MCAAPVPRARTSSGRSRPCRAHRRLRRRRHLPEPPAATPTARSSWRPGWPATAAGWSTSASARSTCRGTRTTRRSSTSGSPARTGPGRYDAATSRRASTTPPATCAGPSAATWPASSTCSPAARSTSDPLIAGVFPIDRRAPTLRAARARATLRGIGFLFEYPTEVALTRTVVRPRPVPRTNRTASTPSAPATRPVRLGFIGAGNYASTMLLPHLEGPEDVVLAHVATASRCRLPTRSGGSASRPRRPTPSAVLADESIDAVVHRDPAPVATPSWPAGRCEPARPCSSRSRSRSTQEELDRCWPPSTRPATTG